MNTVVKITLTILMLLTASVRAQTAKSPPIIAVFDIENRGSPLTKEEIRGLGDYLSTKLSEGGAIYVIAGDEIRKRITKQKLDFKKECFDSSCQIAIGKELAAEYSINSTISRIGTNCIITSQLYELKKATSVDAASARKSCSPDDLIEGVEYIAAKFIKSVGKRTKPDIVATKKAPEQTVKEKPFLKNPIDTIFKTTAAVTNINSSPSNIKIIEHPVVEPKQKPKTGWSLGAGIAGLVATAALASTGFAGAITSDEDLTLPLSLTAATLQMVMVPVIKIGSKSAKGDGVWGSTGIEVTGWITYGFATAFWAMSGFLGAIGGFDYNKTEDMTASGVILLYTSTILGTVSTAFMSIDSLMAHSQASRLLSGQSSTDQTTGVSISPSISPLPPPAQNPEATGMVFGVVGRF